MNGPRIPAGATRDGVVLLHGISRTARSFRKMQAALERESYAVLNLDYASRSKPLQALAEDVHPAIERFAGGVGGSVHFVCHSMGGLLARAYLAKHRPQRFGRMVMLGTPNGGSEIADGLKNFGPYRAFFGPAGQQLVTARDATLGAILPPVDYPVGIIAGNRSVDPLASIFLPRPHDGRVSVENTKLDGMADHLVINASHPFLMQKDVAIEQTIAFLRDGRFKLPAVSPAKAGDPVFQRHRRWIQEDAAYWMPRLRGA